jgi:hypothetical protein
MPGTRSTSSIPQVHHLTQTPTPTQTQPTQHPPIFNLKEPLSQHSTAQHSTPRTLPITSNKRSGRTPEKREMSSQDGRALTGPQTRPTRPTRPTPSHLLSYPVHRNLHDPPGAPLANRVPRTAGGWAAPALARHRRRSRVGWGGAGLWRAWSGLLQGGGGDCGARFGDVVAEASWVRYCAVLCCMVSRSRHVPEVRCGLRDVQYVVYPSVCIDLHRGQLGTCLEYRLSLHPSCSNVS